MMVTSKSFMKHFGTILWKLISIQLEKLSYKINTQRQAIIKSIEKQERPERISISVTTTNWTSLKQDHYIW